MAAIQWVLQADCWFTMLVDAARKLGGSTMFRYHFPAFQLLLLLHQSKQ